MVRVLVTGGTGFIGSKLVNDLLELSCEVSVLSRQPDKASQHFNNKVLCSSDIKTLWDKKPQVVFNLAGEPLANKRWNSERKAVFRESRIGLTNRLFDAAMETNHFPDTLINASAIGFYGDCGDNVITESSGNGNDFAAQLCKDWESAARQFAEYNTRVCIVRIGLVLGKGGGMLKSMLPAFKAGVGGKLGSGKQWQSWIHRDDLVALMMKLMSDNSASGVFNGVAPCPVSNKDFTKTLGKVIQRPTILPMPEVALNVIFGELSELMTCSQRVSSEKFEAVQYEHKFKELEPALKNILN